MDKHPGTSRKRVSPELDAMIRLHKLSTLSVTDGDLETILCEIVDTAIAITRADFGNIQLMDPTSSALRIVAHRGFPQWWVDFWNNVPEGQGSCGASLERGERIVVENVEQSPIFAGATLEVQLKVGVRAVQSTPLVSRSGKPLGMFSTHYRKPQRPDENKLRLMDLLARQAADIIEHVKSIAAIRESEERFRTMADGIPLMIWVSDADGRAQFINRAYTEFFGITLEDLKLRGWQSLIHPEDVDAYASEVEACLRNRRFLEAEVRVKRRDGEWRWVASFGQPRISLTGAVLGLAGSSIDITQRKRAEESLRESEERLRLAMSSGNIGFWDWDVINGQITWSSELCEIFGVDSGTVLTYEDFSSRVHPDDLAAAESKRDTAIRNHKQYDVEFRIIRPGGEIRWVVGMGKGYYDQRGRVVRVVGNNIDITERKRSEAAAMQQASLLRLSFDAIIVWRFDSGIESWNRGAETLYGFTESEAIGRRAHDLLGTVFPVSCSETETVLKDQGKWEGELRHRTKDGREVIVSARLQAIRGDDEAVRILETSRDITERKHIEEALAEEGRRKDEFLSLLGHELRNPLAAISTALQVLSRGTPAQRAELEKVLDGQVTVMRRLLDDLLDFGRITHGYIELQKERIDLAEFLQQKAAAVQSGFANRRQDLILQLPSEPVLFMADRMRLEQIATNLLSNASRYTSPGGRIELSGAREATEVVLRCKDNGEGIPPEKQEKIFEPFTRGTDRSQGQASLGIGLTLAKQLAELHGGTISVESAGAGMGSEFTVRLPLLAPLPAQPAVLESEPALAPHYKCSIVVVEDNTTVARVIEIALEGAGHEVHVFPDGRSALAGVSGLKPDAVLLDIGLPNMDGYELAAELKKRRSMRSALFVAISGFKRQERPGKTGDHFDYYFTKPVDVRALLALFDTRSRVRPADTSRKPREPKKLRVLLVEDHVDLAASTAILLRREGLEVLTALTGREALEVAPNFRPQLVLCDKNLPDMNGLEVIRRLRSNPSTQQIHAVILTAMSEIGIRTYNREAKKLGVDAFMSKPLMAEAVRTLVSKLKPRRPNVSSGDT